MPNLHLVSYEQSIEEVSATIVYQVHQYRGADPLMTRQDKALRIITQSGKAVAWRKRFVPPTAIFAGNLIEQPRVSERRVDVCHWEVSWQYIMAVAAGTTVDREAACRYPANPTFTELT
jgi:hypothetical protein